jgi:hypothetical protein
MNQTNNRIREEWKEWAFTHKQHLGRMCDRKEIEDYWISKLDSLLKTQREEMIEKMEKMIKIVNYQLGGFFIEEESYNEAIKDILSLIKNN